MLYYWSKLIQNSSLTDQPFYWFNELFDLAIIIYMTRQLLIIYHQFCIHLVCFKSSNCSTKKPLIGVFSSLLIAHVHRFHYNSYWIMGRTWKGNDQKPIRSNFTFCPRHQHIQLRRRKVKQRKRKPMRQLLLKRWPKRYPKSQRQSESALLLRFINIQVIRKPNDIVGEGIIISKY